MGVFFSLFRAYLNFIHQTIHINEPDLLRFLTQMLLLTDLALNIPYKTVEVTNLKISYVNKCVLPKNVGKW